MERDLIIKKCNKCGALIHVITDCNCNDCGITCCNQAMEKLVPNSVDAAVEKHVPVVEIDKDRAKVVVNHVMDEDHYIEWIAMITDSKECIKYLKPGDMAEVEFKYVPGSRIYSYCNKHGLWMKEI